MAPICNETRELGTIPWSLLAQETVAGASLSHLLKMIKQGTETFNSNDPALANLWPMYNSICAQEGILLYQDRVVVPSTFRHPSAPSCSTSRNINSGTECSSHHLLGVTPPIPAQTPSSPFQAILADFFDYRGCQYLVVGDCLPSWVEVLS